MKAHTKASVGSVSLVPEGLVSRLPQLDSRVSLIVVPFGLVTVQGYFEHIGQRTQYQIPNP